MPPSPRRPVRSVAGLLVVVAGLVASVSACSSSVPPQSDVVDALRRSGVPAAEARCTAKALYTTLSAKQLADVIDRGAGGVPKNDTASTDDASDKLSLAISKCRDAAVAGQTTEAGGSTTTVPATATSGPSFNTTGGSTPPADGVDGTGSTTVPGTTTSSPTTTTAA